MREISAAKEREGMSGGIYRAKRRERESSGEKAEMYIRVAR